jgi:hypothetical protein
MSNKLIYKSKSTFKSLWQEYLIYDDHVEFSTHFGNLTIPFDAIENVQVKPSDVKGLMKGDLQLKGFKPALKLDWANFQEHVILDKKDGRCRRFLFTPENPQEFKEILDKLLKENRK